MNGAIYTTDSTGTVVNGNIYQNKQDVYLSGGPQNQNSAGLTPGTYYFEVTDPNGSTVLSTDPAVDRQLTVNANGVVAGATGPNPHANGTFNPANGATPVQLFPYDDTPNPGGEYKVYVVPTADATIAPDGVTLIFSNNDAKSDNFKVLSSVQTVPEPASLALAGFGLTGLAGSWLFRRTRAGLASVR